MVQLTCIATRGGDKGKTSLGNGERVVKNAPRIEAIGTIDELNSAIGLACSVESNQLSCETLDRLNSDLRILQNDLFDMGADLCMPDQAENGLRISSQQVHHLDAVLEYYNNQLTPLTSFVLPGGTQKAAHLHLCRTIARRGERHLVALHTNETLNPELLRYINRISDVFFVMARVANDNGRLDILWEPGKYHGK